MPSESTPLSLRSTSLQINLSIWRREEARRRDIKRGGFFILALCASIVIVTYVAEPTVENNNTNHQVQAHAGTQNIPVNMTTKSAEAFCGLTTQDAGYVKLSNKVDDHYFYWYFESRSQPSTDPLVLWLTGELGCSSMTALLTENGPCHVLPDLSTQLNPYSWTNESNVIWLDQPTRVGFTYGDERDADNGEDNVGEDIYYFLQGFFEKHLELSGRDFYITGESYGGHSVPVVAHYVWQKNKATTDTSQHINLKGIAIGNGLMQASIQWPHYIDMAIDNAYNISLVNATELDKMKVAMPVCISLLEQCPQNTTACIDGRGFCMENLYVPLLKAGRNPYDIRMPCKNEGNGMECYDMSYVSKYLDAPNVRKSLGVDVKRAGDWQECNSKVREVFLKTADAVTPINTYMADLLNNGVRVLIYAGDADLVCNWYGNHAWTQALQWKGRDGFNAAPETPFIMADGMNAGMVRSFNNQLTFLRVFNSGHMVPHDQPAVALDMLSKFVKNDAF
ncbi:unnamed protein product [Peronospora belbahrii]|uniref:Carboxypeptidase n=1 Tax=Peronospora belbahrii TaxID=622444 RepID=A0ABN8CVZ5_9STRA|nr:unnamed protein product [Peronospora belbahrii]